MFKRTFAILLLYYRQRRLYKYFVPNGTNCQPALGRTLFERSYFFLSVTLTGSPNCSKGISNS